MEERCDRERIKRIGKGLNIDNFLILKAMKTTIALSILFLFCSVSLSAGDGDRPVRVALVDNTLYTGSPVLENPGTIQVDKGDQYLPNERLEKGSLDVEKGRRLGDELNPKFSTLQHLLASQRESFRFFRQEYNAFVAYDLMTKVLSRLGEFADCSPELLAPSALNRSIEKHDAEPGTMKAVRLGRYETEGLKTYASRFRNAERLVVLDSCWFEIDLLAFYSSKERDRRVSGQVALALCSSWEIYEGNELQDRFVLRDRKVTVQGKWTDQPLDGELPVLNELVSAATDLASEKIVESLREKWSEL